MKIPSLIITLTVAAALVALAQEGTLEDVKRGAIAGDTAGRVDEPVAE